MPTTITGAIRRLDGAPEPSAYLTATLVTPAGKKSSVLAGGPVSRPADLQGQIMLPLDLKVETEVRLRLATPGRTVREATVRLRPGVIYTLETVFSGEGTPTPTPPGAELSGDGDTVTIDGTVSPDGETFEIGG